LPFRLESPKRQIGELPQKFCWILGVPRLTDSEFTNIPPQFLRG